MAVIEVERIGMSAFLQRAEIMVDGSRRAMLRAGEPVVIEVPPGPHVVKARVGASQSAPMTITVAGGDSVRLTLDVTTVVDGLAGGHWHLEIGRSS